MKKKTWFIITWAILGVVFIWATSLFLFHTFGAPSLFLQRGTGTLEITDVKTRGGSLQGQRLSVVGHVAPGSVNWDEKTQVVTFALADDRETLNVTFRGSLPNNFKPGAALEVMGTYRPDGIFEANGFGRPSTFCLVCHG